MIRPYVLYIDRYHLGDPLLLQSFARSLAARSRPTPLLIVHGAEEATERLIEEEGREPERHEGRLSVRSTRDHLLYERAARDVSRRVSSFLTDAVVSAVPLSGADRGLLRREGSLVKTGNAAWIGHLLDRNVVPVISLLAADRSLQQPIAVGVADAILALVRALEAGGSAFLLRGQVAQRSGASAPKVLDPQVPQVRERISEPRVVEDILSAGVEVRLARLSDLQGASPGSWPLAGTRTPSGTAKTGD